MSALVRSLCGPRGLVLVYMTNRVVARLGTLLRILGHIKKIFYWLPILFLPPSFLSPTPRMASGGISLSHSGGK